MSWFTIAIFAQVLLGLSVVFDKKLLQKRVFDPLVYTFWSALLGSAVVVFVPFGLSVVSPSSMAIAFFSGAVFVAALYLLFSAVHRGTVSGVYPLLDSLTPLATLVWAFLFLGGRVGTFDLWGIGFLVIGGGIFFLCEEKSVRRSLHLIIISSATLFGLANVLAKIVFEDSSFVTGFFWIKIGGVLAALALCLAPALRARIFHASRTSVATYRVGYMGNRILAGAGSVLVFFAVSKFHPAVVDATQILKYVIVFVAASVLVRERFSRRILAGKFAATVLVFIGLLILGVADFAHRLLPPDPHRAILWGVTFSNKYSRSLGLDWKENFEAMMRELRPKKLRLVAYWDEIEKKQGMYDFSDLDWQMMRARQSGTEVILALGMKVPRWPECHIPEWVSGWTPEEQQEALERYMKMIIMHYRESSTVTIWQVENEPFLRFGDCPVRQKNFLDQEVVQVKTMDPTRPILITDGGEFGDWYSSARRGDIFGTTMYRKIFPKFFGSVFGVIEYPLAPSYFRVKENIIRRLADIPNKRFLVSELQAEPWGRLPLSKLPYHEQTAIFSPEYFLQTIEYAKNTGFDEYYLWGIEWWYWAREKQGDVRFWESAKMLFEEK